MFGETKENFQKRTAISQDLKKVGIIWMKRVEKSIPESGSGMWNGSVDGRSMVILRN